MLYDLLTIGGVLFAAALEIALARELVHALKAKKRTRSQR